MSWRYSLFQLYSEAAVLKQTSPCLYYEWHYKWTELLVHCAPVDYDQVDRQSDLVAKVAWLTQWLKESDAAAQKIANAGTALFAVEYLYFDPPQVLAYMAGQPALALRAAFRNF
jgi:hypothetical protein